MSTKRGFLAGVVMGALGGFSGANVLMRRDPGGTPGRDADANGDAPDDQDRPRTDPGKVAEEVTALVKEERESVYAGVVPELGYKSTLAQCALQHAEAMAESGEVSHGDTRARYNQFGLGVQIPNDTIAEKIDSDWENIASADATGMGPKEIASALFDEFDEDILLYRPWSLQGAGVIVENGSAYAVINYL
jgi:hypothetical protein